MCHVHTHPLSSSGMRRRRARRRSPLCSRARARYLVAHAKLLLPLCRGGRGVALASGAADALHARAPLDVANLARALGFRPEHAHACVAATARRAAERSRARRIRLRGGVEVLAPGRE